MHKVMVVIAAFASVLAGCGVETANTAATVAGMKKLGIEDGKKSMEQAEKKVGKAVTEMHDRAEKDAEKQTSQGY